ncbi:MAG: glycosyltransferase [Ruminococcus sp.]|nr:glycosyltransferase [Ruminococcus sp.]
MKRIKILYVVEAFGGGVFTYLVELANKLSLHYDITIAYGLRDQTPSNFKDFFSLNIRFIEVKHFERSVNPFNDIKAIFEIKRIQKAVNPDIIHLHSSKAGVIGRFACNGKKTKLFYTPHGYSFLMKDQSALKRAAYKAIEWIFAKTNCTTISCSLGEHKETLKLTKNAVYVNNGINVDELKKLLQNISMSSKVSEHKVFTLGRICYQKNPELFNEIAEFFPEIPFIWIGDGDLRDKLTADNIRITGWLQREEALKVASDSDIFILTSLWEGLPISLLEAMYMKKTCIVSKVIGNKDVIKTDCNGFVCEDLDGFVQAVRSAVSEDMSAYQNNANAEILKKYNTEVMAGKYDKIYRTSVQKKDRE